MTDDDMAADGRGPVLLPGDIEEWTIWAPYGAGLDRLRRAKSSGESRAQQLVLIRSLEENHVTYTQACGGTVPRISQEVLCVTGVLVVVGLVTSSDVASLLGLELLSLGGTSELSLEVDSCVCIELIAVGWGSGY
ncbi:hypothetical protein N7457_008163 [Penicillium paradoxum]|uniref:uncharacterized protein n=1 Tax=Penicillium paradoxum TaxID=176176 RepID=UPI002548233B|nr:uncharacterized protein N7457_008163 [Penicillium paradoxum]KAJ5773267.1 hypothetical protein N7457_008163 [Penicillium paradoxum]